MTYEDLIDVCAARGYDEDDVQMRLEIIFGDDYAEEMDAIQEKDAELFGCAMGHGGVAIIQQRGPG